jgi:transposase
MKQIPFLNDYYISEEGEVFSKKRGALKKLKSHIDTSRYYRIGLKDLNGKERKYLIHRLVAITYLDNPKKLKFVNHKDGDKYNNHFSNLEWCTFQENMKHAYSTGLKDNIGQNNGKTKLSDLEVITIYKDLLDGYRVCDIAKKYKVTRSCIGKIKRGENWPHLLKDLPKIKMNKKSNSLSEKTVRWVCEMLETRYTISQILKMSTTDLTVDQIDGIKRRKCYKRIVSEYNF